MLRLSVFVKRRADISQEDFARHWIEIHGPLVRDFPEIKKSARRYIQSLVSDGLPPFVERAPYDGIAEFWFDDLAGMNAAFASEEYRTLGVQDEAKILDRSMTKMMLTIDHKLI